MGYVDINERFKFTSHFIDWRCFAGGWSYYVRINYENYSEILRP